MNYLYPKRKALDLEISDASVGIDAITIKTTMKRLIADPQAFDAIEVIASKMNRSQNEGT